MTYPHFHPALLALVLIVSIVGCSPTDEPERPPENDGSPEGCMTAAGCNDDNPCTLDACVEESCVNNNAPNGSSCEEVFTCRVGESCINGICDETTGVERPCDTLSDECCPSDCTPESDPDC